MKAQTVCTTLTIEGQRGLIAALLISLLVISNGVTVVQGRAARITPVSNQLQVLPIGITAFIDETETNASSELGQRLARELKQKLTVDYRDVLAKLIGLQNDKPPTRDMTVDQLVALGKQYGARFVVRGGVLAMTAEDAGDEMTGVQLYAEIIAVESATITTVRADGSGTQTGTTVGAGKPARPTTGERDGSAKARVLTLAVDQLAAAIHSAILSPDESLAKKNQSGPAEDVVTADADEELGQLITQAEALVSNGAGSADSLKKLSRSIEGLRVALNSKAEQMEHGEDTSRTDEIIATRKRALQSAVAAITEQVSSDEASSAEPSADKKGVLAHIGESLGDALNLMQKIQEMRSTLRAAIEGGVEQTVPAQEVVEEVSGVVTESGEPVEGITVTEPESGASATTDSKGSYTLRGVVAGRMANLSLTKAGKQIGYGKIEVLRGHPQIADFQLHGISGRSGATAALRIIPSTVVVNAGRRSGAGYGVLKGVVVDSQGKPLARAMVDLKGLAIARTDSEGKYIFLNVPAGDHQLSVQKSGLNLKSTLVAVSPDRTIEHRIKFSSDDRAAKEPARQPLVLAGTGTVLHGVIRDDDKHPLAGARITAIQSAAAVSVITTPQGNYEIKDLKPGQYRLLISKAGYQPVAETLNMRLGKTEERDFKLKKSESAFIARVLEAKRSSRAETSNNRRPADPPNRPIEVKKEQSTSGPKVGDVTLPRPGQLKGLVIDARSGSPIAGASVAISGRGFVTTGSDGRYGLGNLSPGPYQILVRKTGFSVGGGTITIRAGETATTTLRLIPAASPPIRFRVPGRT